MRLLFTSLIALAFIAPVRAQGPNIDVPAGARLLMRATGQGSQVYTCTGGQWILTAPDAKLLDTAGKIIGKHFAGPTWQLIDSSEVKGKPRASRPAADGVSIPDLLVAAVPGTGRGKFASVAYIRRTETHGGAAPKSACTGGTLPVPYTATYSFYAAK